MSRNKEQGFVVRHESGQEFVQKSAQIRAIKNVNLPEQRQVDLTTGELVTKPAERRYRIVTKSETGEVATLDAVSLTQLAIATGKELDSAHVRLLKGAEVTWQVGRRTEGQMYYFDHESTTQRMSPRTGKYTAIILLEPAERFEDAWDNIPERDSTVVIEAAPDDSFAAFQATVRAQLGIGETTTAAATEVKPAEDDKDSKKKQS